MRKYIVEGKTYTFNRIHFIDLLNGMLVQKNDDGSAIRVPKISVFTRIADKTDLTVEAIKQWEKGKGCPGDIERVKACAEVLNVDFFDLLIPCGSEEMNKLNDKEMALLEEIFAGCVSYYYEQAEWFFNENIEKSQYRELEQHIPERVSEITKKMHAITDQNALFISEDIRYRIHRFLNDFEKEYDIWDMQLKWKESKVDSEGKDHLDICMMTPMEYALCCGDMRTHEDGIYLQGLNYLEEEINLATKLSYDYPDIPIDFYDDVSIDGESFDRNGKPKDLSRLCHPEYGINPGIIYKDYATRIMKNAFAVEFPEIVLS